MRAAVRSVIVTWATRVQADARSAVTPIDPMVFPWAMPNAPAGVPSPGRALAALLCAAALACQHDDGHAHADSSSGEGGSSNDSTGSITTATTTAAADSSSEGSSGQTDASSGGSSSGSSTTGDTNVLDDASIERIRAAVADSLGDGYATGYSVAIWRDGEVIYSEGFGTKDAASNPVTTDTVFQIGSDTKKMTAIALLREVDAGTIELDTTVGDLLPGVTLAVSPGVLESLTVHQLLSHQTGLFDYTPWSDAPDDAELQARVAGAFAAAEYAMMPAGIAWSYSNPNFSLAGALVEVLGDRPWAEVVIDDIATPLGMAHTYARRDDMLAHETDVASGFGPILDADFDTFDLIEIYGTGVSSIGWTTPENHVDNAFTRPAGLVWSTASDMATLAGFFVHGDDTVLSDALRETMSTGQVGMAVNVAPDEVGYGYGLMVAGGFSGPQGYRATPLLQHGGNTLDMSSAFLVLPEQGVGVSILSNGSGESMDLVAAVALEEAAADRLPEPSTPPQLLDPPAADLTGYAGAFSDLALGDATITWSGTDLEIDVPSFAMLGASVDPVLMPIYRDVFFMTVEGTQFDLSFYPAPDGTPNAYAVNRSFVFGRAAMGAPRPPVATLRPRDGLQRVSPLWAPAPLRLREPG